MNKRDSDYWERILALGKGHDELDPSIEEHNELISYLRPIYEQWEKEVDEANKLFISALCKYKEINGGAKKPVETSPRKNKTEHEKIEALLLEIIEQLKRIGDKISKIE